MGVNVWARVTIELSAHCTAAAHDDFRIRFLNSSVVLRRVFSIIFMTLRSVFGEGGKKRHGVGPAISARRKPQTKDNNTGKSRHSRLPIFVCHGPPSIFRKRPAVFSDFRSTVTTPSPPHHGPIRMYRPGATHLFDFAVESCWLRVARILSNTIRVDDVVEIKV